MYKCGKKEEKCKCVFPNICNFFQITKPSYEALYEMLKEQKCDLQRDINISLWQNMDMMVQLSLYEYLLINEMASLENESFCFSVDGNNDKDRYQQQ